MIARIIAVLISLWTFAQVVTAAQDVFVPSFGGRIFADGRPVNWAMEVRLEGQDSSIVATAHTRGSSEFSFTSVFLRRNANYFLVILDGQMHEARLTLLNIYIRQKRYDDALKQIAAYLKANPEAPQREQVEKLRIQIESALSR